ncbi:substrate-binding domain-containing protein [Actinomadura sp. NAK00032]|uniref:substrate-binding domain-containing protein n=1 Tax=Actinomadura sp. NAK00032 TaxID=2742128 RepID=UPI001590DFD9|nr:substrate-binding domain-containing protein [Actinomadura sp. NAK00032]QKW36883.1 substrate-binding domain-containing protein [Actinomadura sp. NAK00032]
MKFFEDGGLNRRKLLFSGAAVGGGALLTACTSNAAKTSGAAEAAEGGGGDDAAPGKHVTIGFSAPAADHGFIAAITANARTRAKSYSDVTLEATEGTNDVAIQIAAVQSMINKKVDAIVILPYDGKALTEVATKAMNAGIPVVNLDRVFSSPVAYRTWVGGDNYGSGVSAGNYIGNRLKGKKDPVILEIAGLDNLELTQQRSAGFKAGLANFGLTVTDRQAGDFTAATGQKVAAQMLQAHSKVDAIWNQDDDQGIGVEAAIKQAGRDEFFMVGCAGSAHVMQQIKSGKGPVVATVLYSPIMSASAVSLARLIAQGRGLGEMAEKDVPASVTAYSAVVTKENVDNYMSIGFK